MTTEQITEYLNKYSITTKELLAEHILQLKRNTYPNVELISSLVCILYDKFSVFNSFSPKTNKTKEEILHTICMEQVDKLLEKEYMVFNDFIDKKSISFMPDGTYYYKGKEITNKQMLLLKSYYELKNK